MKKNVIILMTIFLSYCGSGNLAKSRCEEDCSDQFWRCAVFSNEVSFDYMNQTFNTNQADQLLMACGVMNEQCFKSCEKKHPAIF